MANLYQQVPIGDVKPSPWTTTKMTKRQKESMLESLRRYGQLVPFVVYLETSKSKTFSMIDGSHRHQAMVELGKKTVLVMNLGSQTEIAAREIHLALNLNNGKQAADPLADAIETIVESPPTEKGKAMAEAYLAQFVPLTKAPTEVVKQLRSRKQQAPAATNPLAKPSWVDFKFRVAHSAARVCDDALSHIEQSNNVKRQQAFEYLCADYLSGAQRQP